MASILNSDTAVGRGVRTAIQAMIGFIVGLVGTVWAVPGVPAAVENYLEHNLLTLTLTVGIPAGIVAFIWNALRRGVKTY